VHKQAKNTNALCKEQTGYKHITATQQTKSAQTSYKHTNTLDKECANRLKTPTHPAGNGVRIEVRRDSEIVRLYPKKFMWTESALKQ
jgi:hypothetical protein